jgi:hypothetical protein
MAKSWFTENESIDYSKHSRFQDPAYIPPIFPENLRDYPVVVCYNSEIAVVAINKHKGFVLHRDGAKTEPSDVEKLLLSQEEVACGSCRWGEVLIKEMQKKGQL